MDQYHTNQGLFHFDKLSAILKSLLQLHTIAGVVLISLMLVVFYSKKGGWLHRKLGFVVIFFTVLAVGLAFPVSVWRVVNDPDRNIVSLTQSILLGTITINSICWLWFGWISLQLKNRMAPDFRLRTFGVAFVSFLVSLAVGLVGLYFGRLFVLFYSLFFLLPPVLQLWYWISIPKIRMHWWIAHMGGMLSSCIAVITAFFNEGIRGFFPGALPITVRYFAPPIILIPLFSWWIYLQYRKFNPSKSK